MELLLCHISGFLREYHSVCLLQCPPGYSMALQLSNLGCIYLKRSFLARSDCRSDSPDSFESVEQWWRDQAFIILVESLEMQSRLCAHMRLLGGHWETHLFSCFCFPSITSPPAGLLRCCWRICFFCHPCSFVVLGLCSNKNVPLPFLALTGIYSTRHRSCFSALSE